MQKDRRRSSDSRTNGFQATETATTNGRWKRIRKACVSGQLTGISYVASPSGRKRRNALADTSAVSTTNNEKSQKQQFLQLVERIRELEHEIAPELHLYQGSLSHGSNRSPFSSVPTPTSATTAASYPSFSTLLQQSSASTSSSSRNVLSPRMIEKAHQIPERFWMDWYEKQMQEKIADLEYIRENLGCSPHSSLLSESINEDNYTDQQQSDRKRKSILFLHEAQRLANKRRNLLGGSNTVVEKNCTVAENGVMINNEFSPIKERCLNNIDKLLVEGDSIHMTVDNDDEFCFEHRSDTSSEISSEEDDEQALDEDDTLSANVIPEEKRIDLDADQLVEQEPCSSNVDTCLNKPNAIEHVSLDRSRLSISLPFTYTECRSKLPNSAKKHRQIVKNCTTIDHPTYLENVSECSESSTQEKLSRDISIPEDNRSDSSTDDIAEIKNNLDIMSISLQGKMQRGLETLYTKSVLNTTVEFGKSQLSNTTESRDKPNDNKQFLYVDITQFLDKTSHVTNHQVYELITERKSISSASALEKSTLTNDNSIDRLGRSNERKSSSMIIPQERLVDVAQDTSTIPSVIVSKCSSPSCEQICLDRSLNNLCTNSSNTDDCSDINIELDQNSTVTTTSCQTDLLSCCHLLQTLFPPLNYIQSHYQKSTFIIYSHRAHTCDHHRHKTRKVLIKTQQKAPLSLAYIVYYITEKEASGTEEETKKKPGATEHSHHLENTKYRNKNYYEINDVEIYRQPQQAYDRNIISRRSLLKFLEKNNFQHRRTRKREEISRKQTKNRIIKKKNKRNKHQEKRVKRNNTFDKSAFIKQRSQLSFQLCKKKNAETTTARTYSNVKTQIQAAEQINVKCKERNFTKNRTTNLKMDTDETQNRLAEHVLSSNRKTKLKRFRVCLRRRATRRFHKRRNISTSEESLTTENNEIHQLTNLIESQISMRNAKHRKRHIIVINYKPVFFNTPEGSKKDQKLSQSLPTKLFQTEVNELKRSSTLPSVTLPRSGIVSPTDEDLSSEIKNPPKRRRSRTGLTTSSDTSLQQQSHSFDLPDVDDPRLFIDMIYTQIFDETGKLRQEVVQEPEEVIDYVRQCVDGYRRNSMKRDSITSFCSNKSTTSSYRKHSLLRRSKNKEYVTWSEEEEQQQQTPLQNRLASNSRRNSSLSKRFSIKFDDGQFLPSVDSYKQQHQSLFNQQRNSNAQGTRCSMDDTDNDEDTFFDLHNQSVASDLKLKSIRTNYPQFNDSGYQSFERSPRSFFDGNSNRTPDKIENLYLESNRQHRLSKSKSDGSLAIPFKQDAKHDLCSNCSAMTYKKTNDDKNHLSSPQVIMMSPVTALRHRLPTMATIMRYISYIIISKHVMLLPLLLFMIRQRNSDQ